MLWDYVLVSTAGRPVSGRHSGVLRDSDEGVDRLVLVAQQGELLLRVGVRRLDVYESAAGLQD
jgi:hypothetical protein